MKERIIMKITKKTIEMIVWCALTAIVPIILWYIFCLIPANVQNAQAVMKSLKQDRQFVVQSDMDVVTTFESSESFTVEMNGRVLRPELVEHFYVLTVVERNTTFNFSGSDTSMKLSSEGKFSLLEYLSYSEKFGFFWIIVSLSVVSAMMMRSAIRSN